MALQNKLVVVAKISSKNQITIPKEIRNKHKVKEQEEIAFEILEDGRVLVKKNQTDFWNLVAEQKDTYRGLEDEEID